MLTRGHHTCMVVVTDELALASRRWRLTGSAVLVASTLTHGLPVVCCGHRVLRHLLDRLSTAGSPCESTEAMPVKSQPPRGQGQLVSHHDHACVLASGEHDLHPRHQKCMGPYPYSPSIYSMAIPYALLQHSLASWSPSVP